MKELLFVFVLVLANTSLALGQTIIDQKVYDAYASAKRGPELTADQLCTAYNIYHEARGETPVGQIAVAYVGINRASDRKISVCEAVWERAQFSWTLQEPLPFMEDRRSWRIAKALAVKVHEGAFADITLGATHYHRHDISPKWSKAGVGKRRIGAHVFMKVDF